MKVKDLINSYSNVLIKSGFGSAFLDVEILFSHVSGFSRIDIISKSEQEVDVRIFKEFQKLFNRRLKHEPIAYIIGYKNFCGLNFRVNNNVLIPRPLTESLVEIVIDEINKNGKQKTENGKNIIEIGTGSGCIAISLIKKIQSFNLQNYFNFFASDISSSALKIAKINARYFCVNDKIKFLQGNLKFKSFIKYDFIIANLPYVDKNSVNFNNDDQKDLEFEPSRALFHKDKGFYLVRKLLTKIINRKLLSDNGVAFLEIEKGQSDRIVGEFGYYFNVEEFFDGRIVKLNIKK